MGKIDLSMDNRMKLMRNGIKPMCKIFHLNNKPCKPGFVYILRDSDLYKIGYTCYNGIRGVQHRISYHQCKGNSEFVFIHAIWATCGQGLERYLHKLFKLQREYSEFFTLSKQDLFRIEKLNKFNGRGVVHINTLDRF